MHSIVQLGRKRAIRSILLLNDNIHAPWIYYFLTYNPYLARHEETIMTLLLFSFLALML